MIESGVRAPCHSPVAIGPQTNYCCASVAKGESTMSETSTSRKSDPQEPSMEDILASIRRILAEDGGAISQGAEAVDADVAAVPAPETETEPELASEELVMDRTDDPLLADRDAEPSTRRPAGAATEKDVFL